MEDTFSPQDPKIPARTLWMYVLMLAVSVVLAAADIMSGRMDQLIIAIPICIILLIAIFSDRKVSHIPPVLMILMMIAMILIILVQHFSSGTDLLMVIAGLMTGACLMFLGLIFTYAAFRTSPEKYGDSPVTIYITAFCASMTILMLMLAVQWVYMFFTGASMPATEVMLSTVIPVMIGSVITAVLFDRGLGRFVIDSGINRSLESDPLSRYSNEKLKEESLSIIASGESENLEFKSTITTNIKTGENDKRMEKAVLKTIVAFLNTDGGILMIGVSDDGSIYGVDEQEFDNRDKMNLHLTHMISSKIGDEFFPYISFRTIDMEDGKAIIRVNCDKCRKPVFLKDGKEEIFYVRSGPSSVELTGSSLVNYIGNRTGKNRRELVKGITEEED